MDLQEHSSNYIKLDAAVSKNVLTRVRPLLYSDLKRICFIQNAVLKPTCMTLLRNVMV